ncbi:MAG: peptide-N-glycosidase F-related protein, partial [Candidatus Marinimicrobia bacterium]|nr:peptide-N-glycosidase F-related protein [Candidatus Neomarinimicrobiota bacterium]
THMSYLAHETLFYNYVWDALFDPDSSYDEITVFDKEIYTGGWASSITQIVEFPSNEELDQYSGMKVELLRGCPDADGNYSDDGCDDYDRIAHMYLCDEDGSNCYEIARWITPFDRQPHHLTDITPFISVIRPGGTRLIKFQESGWPNSLLTLKIRFYEDDPVESPQEFRPMWIGTVQFNPSYNENRPPTIFDVPENATRVEFVTYITGHGWGSAGCYNCAEFCNSKHIFTVNGGTYEFDTSYPEAGDGDYCMELETIVQGVIPNQYGTWGFGRAGWCPGMDVTPFITDITEYVEIGDDNIMDYEACRVSGNDCVTPPVCQGDGYCPEIAMSSYIIIRY